MKYGIVYALGILVATVELSSCAKPAGPPANAGIDTLAVRSRPAVRPRDPIYDDRFLTRQANRANAVRDRISELSSAEKPDTMEIHRLLLKRKAEISGTRRDLFETDRLTIAEKESLAAPLDSEAIEIADDLLDLVRRKIP